MNWTRNLWDRLTKAPPAVTDSDERRRARLLASILIALIVLSALLLAVALIVERSEISGWQYSLIAFLTMVLAYALSRSRWPQLGAWLMIVGFGGATLIAIPFVADSILAPRMMIFLIVPMLFASLLLGARAALACSVLILLGSLTLPFSLEWLKFNDIVLPLVVIALVAAMSTAAAFLQERYLETIRKQAEEIIRHGEELEDEVDYRTRNIMTVAEVGRTITGARNLDALLNQVVQLIINRFNFYHAQVFLVDEAGEYAVLRESAGPAGKRLLAQGHKLEVSSRSVIGQVTSLGEPVIALDTDTNPVHRRNELLPNTRSEMALPLRIGGRVIGVLDVQSVDPNAFMVEDVPIFQTMADQLAIAIENTRLFEQAQSNLKAIERLNQQLTGDAWRAYMAGRIQSAPMGYRSGDLGLEPIKDGDEDSADPDAISLPLRVRGEPIGAIDIKPKADQEPLDEDAQAMLEAVAERVAVALDNTRLAEQAQRTAWRERIVNQISAKLQRSHDLQVILRTAVSELGRAMEMSRGFARLAPPSEKPLARDEDL